MPPPVRAALVSAGRRFAAICVLDAAWRGALVGSMTVLIVGMIRYFLAIPPVDFFSLTFPLVTALTFAALGWQERPDPVATAARLDRIGNTKDRFVTLLDLDAGSGDRPVETLAREECAGALAQIVPHLRCPALQWKRWAILIVPAASLVLLQTLRPAPRSPDAPGVADPAAQHSAARLSDIARATAAASGNADELSRLAHELEKSAARMLESASSGEATAVAMKELSGLEDKLRRMLEDARAGITAEDIARLADALRNRPETREIADLLASGDVADAAAALRSLLEKLRAEGREDAALEQLARSLEQAAQSATPEEQQRVADQVRRAMEQVAAMGGSRERQAALDQLMKALREAGGSPEADRDRRSAGNASGRQATLREILEAIERLKQGLRDGLPENDPAGGASFSMTPAGRRMPGEDPVSGTNPAGHPGSESDSGTTPDVAGGDTEKPGDPGSSEWLQGRQTSGAVLSETLSAAGDAPRSRVAYKELFEAMAPEAADALRREDIPLGSRQLIRRYFEGIRPQSP